MTLETKTVWGGIKVLTKEGVEMQRILVVDDAELNRELLCEMLKDEYMVEIAEDGNEALKKLNLYEEDTAAILLDLQMPNKDGFSVTALPP